MIYEKRKALRRFISLVIILSLVLLGAFLALYKRH